MVKVGQWLMIVGFFATIILLAVAFWYLFDDQDEIAKQIFMTIPFSFVMLFAGLSTTILFESRDVE